MGAPVNVLLLLTEILLSSLPEPKRIQEGKNKQDHVYMFTNKTQDSAVIS